MLFRSIIAIDAFWQNVNQTTFISTDKIKIAYVTNFKRAKKSYVVVIAGRSESYLKYQELANEMLHHPISVPAVLRIAFESAETVFLSA